LAKAASLLSDRKSENQHRFKKSKHGPKTRHLHYLAPMGRALAFDFGLKRTGIAVSDPLRIVATPQGAVLTDTLKTWIAQYCTREVVSDFVLGMPSRQDGSDTHATQPVREFAEWLRATFPDTPLHFVDERFSSSEARRSLVDSGVKKSKRKDKGLTDTVSAVLLLQVYLQQQG
jgi:putative holliday junction resolvase